MENLNEIKPLPFFFIGKDESSQRVKNYQQGKHKILSDALGRDDTRSVWYSREHIEKLLEEIDHVNGDGLRIYFGAYNQGHQDKGGQLCLIMVPTRMTFYGIQPVHEDILLEEMPDFSMRSSQPRDFVFLTGDNAQTARDRDFNIGSPCPPECKDQGMKYPIESVS